jgi:hypothetical protein
MTDVDDPHGQGLIIDDWHYVRVRPPRHSSTARGWTRLHDAITWIEQTPGGRFYWTLSGNIWFERLEDKIMFQLSWSQ